ncbi:MAG: ATP-binding protein [Comamonadaceae bacterium]
MKNIFVRQSLSKQFLMLSFPILLAGTLVIGWWIGEQVKDSVVHRMGGVTALYVGSFIAPHLQSLANTEILATSDQEAIRSDLESTPLGQKIVALKIWRKDGYVLFSSDAGMAGRTFPVGEGLAEALAGRIFSEISERSQSEQAEHGQPMQRLIETYTPIHADRSGGVIAAAEFYVKPDDVDREAAAAQRRGWLLVAGAMLTMYMLLFVVVRRGSRTIIDQQRELSLKVHQLTEANQQNTQLQGRVIRAAERATAVNEELLQRISADIHDGPVQDLGFALMQLKTMDDACATDSELLKSPWLKSLGSACVAAQSALTDLRAISTDLDLPDIAQIGPAAIAERVVGDFQLKTDSLVTLTTSTLPDDAVFRVKVTLYRVLQEALANTFRHARGADCRVMLSASDSALMIQISDKGPGFDPALALARGRFGLHGMRQRIEVLGGSFDLHSESGTGTTIRMTIPLNPALHEYD